MKIVLNPESMRDTARGLNEAASEYALYGKSLAAFDTSAFAPGVRGTVGNAAHNAGRELRAISGELGSEADALRLRANRAEVASILGLSLGGLSTIGASAGARLISNTLGQALVQTAPDGLTVIEIADALRKPKTFIMDLVRKTGNRYGTFYKWPNQQKAKAFLGKLTKFGKSVVGASLILGPASFLQARRNHDTLGMVSGATGTAGAGLIIAGAALIATPAGAPLVAAGLIMSRVSLVSGAATLVRDYSDDAWNGAKKSWNATVGKIGGLFH